MVGDRVAQVCDIADRLAALLGDSAVEALIVDAGDDRAFGVILQEDLADAAREPARSAPLVAADFAKPAPYVDERTALPALTRLLARPGIEAVVVLASHEQRPLGVVTKRTLLLSLLERRAARRPVTVAL